MSRRGSVALAPRRINANRSAVRRLSVPNIDVTQTRLRPMWESATLCPLCGVRLAEDGYSGNAKTIDHVVPLSAGGAHAMANLRVICRRCNTARGAAARDLVGAAVSLFNVSPAVVEHPFESACVKCGERCRRVVERGASTTPDSYELRRREARRQGMCARCAIEHARCVGGERTCAWCGAPFTERPVHYVTCSSVCSSARKRSISNATRATRGRHRSGVVTENVPRHLTSGR